jgi:hypothetical protein
MERPVEKLMLREVLDIVEATDAKQYTFIFLSEDMAAKKTTNWRRQISNNGMQYDYNVSKHASAVTVRRWR